MTLIIFKNEFHISVGLLIGCICKRQKVKRKLTSQIGRKILINPIINFKRIHCVLLILSTVFLIYILLLKCTINFITHSMHRQSYSLSQ